MKRHTQMRRLPAHYSTSTWIHLLIRSTTSQSLAIHSSPAKLIGSGLKKIKGLKLDGDRSIDCGSYEYTNLSE